MQKIGYRIIEEIKRPDPEIIEKLREFSTCDLCDGSVVYSSMDYLIKPFTSDKRIVGPAVTLKLPLGDSLLVTKALALCKPGDILVIDGRGSNNNALWGDHRSLSSILNGIEGVVMDGVFRDIESCEEIGFPIFARGYTCGSSTKNSHGEINIPITCGGAAVNPGDIIVGDKNGVCVIPAQYALEVMDNASKKIAKMSRLKEEILSTKKIIPDDMAESLRKLGY